MIIGLTGTHSSGEDTVAKYLVSKGFAHVSTSDLLREEAGRRGLPADRETLQRLGNEIRLREGAGYLVQLALSKYPDNVVISGLRNSTEVAAVRRAGFRSSIILAVDAPPQRRYQWARARGRPEAQIGLEKFLEMEKSENTDVPTGLQLDRVIKQADFLIMNIGTIEDLYGRVDQAISMWSVDGGPR